MTEVHRDFPPVVYVPTATPSGGGDARLEMTTLADGRAALFVYSAIDRLQELYRAGSAWALLSVADLQRAYDDVPYDVLFLDQRPVPAGADATQGAGA